MMQVMKTQIQQIPMMVLENSTHRHKIHDYPTKHSLDVTKQIHKKHIKY